MRLRSIHLLLFAPVLALSVHAQSPAAPFLEVIPFGSQTSAQVSDALAHQGFSVLHIKNYVAGGDHLYVGPLPSAELGRVDIRLKALGFHLTLVPDPYAVESSERMHQLEAAANAKLSGTLTPAPSSDLEARALANLGVDNTARTAKALDPEAAAFAAMQGNSARATVDAENQRQARLIADQQAEAVRLQREIDQVNAPQLQESSAATLIRGLSGVVAQATAPQSQNSIQQASQQQLAQIRSLQQQIAANQAAQANRQAAVQIATRPSTQASAQLPDQHPSIAATSSPTPRTPHWPNLLLHGRYQRQRHPRYRHPPRLRDLCLWLAAATRPRHHRRNL